MALAVTSQQSQQLQPSPLFRPCGAPEFSVLKAFVLKRSEVIRVRDFAENVFVFGNFDFKRQSSVDYDCY